jgi:hypothetical protein
MNADKYEYFKKTVNALKEHNASPNSETLTVYVDYLRGLPLAWLDEYNAFELVQMGGANK